MKRIEERIDQIKVNLKKNEKEIWRKLKELGDFLKML